MVIGDGFKDFVEKMGLPDRAMHSEEAPWVLQGHRVWLLRCETSLTNTLRDDGERGEALFARIPAGRWGAKEDLKGAAVFLASGASSHVHGAAIPVDGGWLGR